MTHERFNELLAGPLHHPLPQFTLTRLAMALFHVVGVTGEAGDRALEDWCRMRQERDEQADAITEADDATHEE